MLGLEQILDDVGSDLSAGTGDEDSHGSKSGSLIDEFVVTVKPVPGITEVGDWL
jgi:hypothetical protein